MTTLGTSGRLLRAFAAAAALSIAVQANDTVLMASQPYCRKSPETHMLRWPDSTHEGRLVIFGGKGFTWKITKKGKGGRRKHELELAEAELKNRPRLIRKLIEQGSIKPQVTMFGDIWSFDAETKVWVRIWYEDSPSPVARWKPSTTVVDNSSTLILFGGCKSTSAQGVMNDLWLFKTESSYPRRGRWIQVHTENPPPKRRGHVTTSNRTHIIIIGGKGYDMQRKKAFVHTDVWAVPLAAIGVGESEPGAPRPRAVWTQGSEFPGSPRWGATGTGLTDDNTGKQYVGVFGGRHLNKAAGFHSTEKNAYTYYNELWLYDFEANAWSLVEPADGVAPHKRDHHGATAFDGHLYIFGGRVKELRSEDANMNDLWSFSLMTRKWTQHTSPAGAPAPIRRYMPGFTMSLWNGALRPMVFGGESLPGSTKRTSRNDVWVYAPDNSGTMMWHEVLKSYCLPTGVVLRNGVPEGLKPTDFYDEARGRVIDNAPAVAGIACAMAALSAVAAAVIARRRGSRERGDEGDDAEAAADYIQM